jgi:aminopeptidase
MIKDFERKLDLYAQIIVKVGLNLQPGQRLHIGARFFDWLPGMEAAPLVRLVAKHAYQAGARFVDVLWADQELDLIRAQLAPRDSFEEFPEWLILAARASYERADARLVLDGRDPDLLKEQDAAVVKTMQEKAIRACEPLKEFLGRNTNNWLGACAPTARWAAKVFHDVPAEEQLDRLWDAVFEMCRVNTPDPVAAWEQHIRQLALRCEYLNAKQYTRLEMRGPGTDLRVGLPKRHVWISARMKSEQGIPFVANFPTEEVFTTPHKDRVDGHVRSTKPLSHGGLVIEDFSLTFEGGRVVQAQAERGEQTLKTILDGDEGARRLGEVSIVPHSSAISQSGRLFYKTLIDENASNHLALGRGFPFCIEGTEGVPEEYARRGGNMSMVHEDFMTGSGELSIDGIREDGSREPLTRDGEWAFEV